MKTAGKKGSVGTGAGKGVPGKAGKVGTGSGKG